MEREILGYRTCRERKETYTKQKRQMKEDSFIVKTTVLQVRFEFSVQRMLAC